MQPDNYDIRKVVDIMGLPVNSKLSKTDELRIGNNGSLKIDTKKNTYYDFEKSEGGGCLDFIVNQELAEDLKQAAEWAVRHGVTQSKHLQSPSVERSHIYEDEGRKPLRKSVKYTDGSWKQMRWANGNWLPGVKSIRNVPYGLPKLINEKSSKLIYIFEGEKDCELAWEHGLAATTNVGGAGKWKDEFNKYLEGRIVYVVPDNDEPGKSHAKSVHASLKKSGINCKIVWSILKEIPKKGDFTDYMNKEGNSRETFFNLLKLKQEEPDVEVADLQFLRVSDLAGKQPLERDWLITDWIPGNQVTLLYGDGGTGKSQIAMQLCLSVASGANWLGLPAKEGRSIYLTAEDDEDELHRRFVDIARGMSSDLSKYNNCHYISLAGEDALFALQDRGSQTLLPTPLFEEFCKYISRTKPKVAVVDTLADINPADENQRIAARQFIQLLRRPAIEHGCAIVVLAHPSLTGLNSGSGTSGSTGWSNSVRSRLYFARESGENADPNVRILELKKSNYSQIGTTVNVRWKDGVFVHDSGGTQLDHAALNKKAERVFLKLLDAYTEQGRYVNANSGSNYAPAQFASDPEAEGITKPKFRTVMQSLFHRGVIKNESGKGGRGSFIVRKNT